MLWHFCCLPLPRLDRQGGWKTHAEQQKGAERGRSLLEQEGNHFGSNNTAADSTDYLLSLPQSVIQGNQLLLCSAGKERERRRDGSFQLTLILVPSSSGSGSDIISICEQEKQRRERGV